MSVEAEMKHAWQQGSTNHCRTQRETLPIATFTESSATVAQRPVDGGQEARRLQQKRDAALRPSPRLGVTVFDFTF